MKPIENICYNAETRQYLDLYLPECTVFPVFIYFHGGGLEAGDKGDAKAFADYMTSQGIAVISANYRMYPTARYPDFLLDAAEAVAWVFRNIATYGESQGIFVGGSSAGGYISQMLCFDATWLTLHGIRPTDIAGFVHDAGQPTSHYNVLRERGVDGRRVIVDEASALYHVGEEAQYAPMLILVSDKDMENRYEQTLLLVSTLKHFGHSDNVKLKIMNGHHCAYVGVVDKNGESVFGKIIVEFIKEIL